jgi:hypothetical protein
MQNTLRIVLVVLVAVFAATSLLASGATSIYAIVSKVVLEPNEKAPERIQIWGAFTLVDGGSRIHSGGQTLTPQKGYLYFALDPKFSPAQREAALKEWADFMSIAGTGQAVAFGQLGYIGAFSDELINRPAGMPPYVLIPFNTPYGPVGSFAENPIRKESTPAKPTIYPLNTGLTKLSRTGNLADVVKKLEETLK